MTYSFTDTELELLRDALSCAIISEEQIATCISNPKQPLKKDSIETLKVSRRWLLGWYELQEKLGIKREPDKDAMDAISRVAPARRGRPRKDKVTVISHVARRGRPPKFEIKPPVSLTLYKIKKGFFDNLTVLEMAAANNVSVIDIHTFLNNQGLGLGHKQYKRKYRGLHFLWLVRKIKAKGYKDLADHLKVSRQCTQEKASLYGISETSSRYVSKK